ncbi:MAG: hypothetical protein QOJ91_1858 [Sphingomonadales bacterium]|jgi:hypothetical protein|nr:hypothetical protein [Sphingomonadales bacterium]
MDDPASLAALTGSGLLAVGLLSAALLKAWHGWLELRRMELAARGGGLRPRGRLEVADLRERVRRLEAIASGGDI